MSMHDLLANLPSVTVKETKSDIVHAFVVPEHFTAALDELINCRTLAAATNQLGLESATVLSSHGLSLAHLYGTDDRIEEGSLGIHALLHDDTTRSWLHLSTAVQPHYPEYPSATRFIMAAQWFERYLADMFGIIPAGHPDFRRLVHHENMPLGMYPLRKDFLANDVILRDDVPYPMQQVAGEGVYEVGVGPVYNRIAESIHFRINSTGERIMTFENKAFYKHKGIEKLLEGKTITEAIPFIERISDSAVTHALAFAQAVEAIEGTEVPMRAKAIRSLFNELERVIAHIEDISSIAGIGAGFTSMKRGFVIKERLIRLSEDLFKNRCLRGLIVPGGVARDFSDEDIELVRHTVVDAIDEMERIVSVAMHSDGLRDRLELIGILKKDAALVYGAVGLVARASGVDHDVRRDHPYAAYDRFVPKIITSSQGDVFTRFRLRMDELLESRRLIIDISSHLGDGPVKVPCHPERGMGIGAVEGGRGETVHVLYMKDGIITRATIRDASFMNWPLLHEMLPTATLSDFPLIVKSLGLSVAANDL